MAEQFYTILTNIGKAKIANSLPTGQKVNLTKMKIGDSNGTYYNPSENQTELVHKVYECNVTSVDVDEINPSWITITAVIPSDVGGFSIREVGIFDDSNSLIAIGKYPETYKPVASDGSTKELYIKMTLEVTNAASVEFKIDPTVILATKKDISNLDAKIEQNTSQLNDNVNDINNLKNITATKNDLDTINTNVLNNTQEINSVKNNIETNYAKKSEIGAPTDSQIDTWFEAHPEATTTVQDNSLTWEKLTNEMKINLNKIVKSTVFNTDGSIKEIFSDNQYKITTISNSNIVEKWYKSDSTLLFTKNTVINSDGSISESLV